MSTNEFQEIPKVELVNFSFSPPGPMGWSAAEYETMLEDPETFLSQNKYRKAEPPTGDVELIELPIKTRKPQEAYVLARSETDLAAAAVQEETPEAEAAVPIAAMQKETPEAETAVPIAAIQKETPEAETAVPIAAIQKETPEAEAAVPIAAIQKETQEAAADIISMSDTVLQDQMEKVQNTINTSMSLIEMFSALNKKEHFSSESESDDKQESRFRSKRKSKHRSSTRKNRVLFM
ncbi:hypothetical protein ACTSEZ_00785 [Metabacillus sp. JX24]|uniref:hypothetical protein n=1 Tax=Metabacillus sp. JX24 TaxID=3240759 RepID=UPI00350FCE19